MKKTYGTLAALSAITAKIAVGATVVGAHDVAAQSPVQGNPGDLSALTRDLRTLSDQCDYIWENRTNVQLLTQELNRLLSNSPESRSCDEPMSPEMRQACEEECTGLILALLGDPVAQIPPGLPGNGDEGGPIVIDETEGY